MERSAGETEKNTAVSNELTSALRQIHMLFVLFDLIKFYFHVIFFSYKRAIGKKQPGGQIIN